MRRYPWIYNNLNYFKIFLRILTNRKPKNLDWRDFWLIWSTNIRYQPLIFPDRSFIPKRCSDTIPSSFLKLNALKLPNDFSDQTYLDIGCSEGFFVLIAALRGAKFARGVDFELNRIKIAKIMAKVWNLQDRIEFSRLKL
jgi:2-polyprenyl-3-methyl-5-hydroxy-6-metoxy-1,4-benzoquinol methylase